MASSGPTARRALAAAIGSWTMAGLLLLATAAAAEAQPAPPPPPPTPGAPPAPASQDCTAADLARVSAGVASATADYLDNNPDVNNFFTGLHGKPDNEIQSDVANYMNANPQVQSDLNAIRAPLSDLRNRCQ
ncbi:MAG TPA: heme-binding protein [Mycobacterium sp.]|nr:heme-binding protein [Mycobacterium sp.]